MKIDLSLTEYFAVPIEEAWNAITNRHVLAQWLMENDFEPRIGARFVLRRADLTPGWRGWVDCEVLELVPPTRMVWSWSDGLGEGMTSRVVFELQEERAGTRLTIQHIGDSSDATGQMIRERWPIKLGALALVLGR